jgi:tetratricopeptide (TPR) repeat protein
MLDEDHLGDRAGALRAYTRMAEIERALSAPGAAALRELGVAELGLATALPPAQAQEKRAALELAGQALKNSSDTESRLLKASVELQLGDLSDAAGDRASAAHSYQLALAEAQAVLAADPRNARAQRSLVQGSRRLAEDLARSGDRGHALATLEPALELARQIDRDAPPGAVNSRSVVARAWQGAGSVYELLAIGALGEQRDRDREAAGAWFQQSLAEWRRLAEQKDFSPALRREMDTLSEGSAVR